jgi:hypothetical protein
MERNDGRSTYAVSAASATVVNSDWNNLLANMHRNLADEWLVRPAWTWWTTYWLLPMDEAIINDVQQALTYILLTLLNK